MSDTELQKFRILFDHSSIVRRWEEKGFTHVGTIFCGEAYDVSFPCLPHSAGVEIEQRGFRNRKIEISMEMLELIYETKIYILGLEKTIQRETIELLEKRQE